MSPDKAKRDMTDQSTITIDVKPLAAKCQGTVI